MTTSKNASLEEALNGKPPNQAEVKPPRMTARSIRSLVQRAIESLKAEKPPLNFAKITERTVAQRLAGHLEGRFVGWNVDVDYNQDRDNYKFLVGIRACSEQRSTDRIFPDIIVHHRRRSGGANNLLVVEMKKNDPADPCDTEKLKRMTRGGSGFEYRLGLYLHIDKGKFHCTWYRKGAKCP